MNEINISKKMLSEVLKLLKIFYTIPITTSSTEQTFSALRWYSQSIVSQPRLNHTLLYIHKENTDEIDDVSIAYNEKMKEGNIILATCKFFYFYFLFFYISWNLPSFTIMSFGVGMPPPPKETMFLRLSSV